MSCRYIFCVFVSSTSIEGHDDVSSEASGLEHRRHASRAPRPLPVAPAGGHGDRLVAGGQARGVVRGMIRSYWHVYMVDHDYIAGDIFRVFAQVLANTPPHPSPSSCGRGAR